MRRIEYKEGQVIGDSGVVYLHDVDPHITPGGQIKRRAKFRCKCGAEFEPMITHVKSGITKSCGCLKRELKTIHGMKDHPLYPTWSGMKARCLNSNDKDYDRYGGYGIVIYDEWVDNPSAFFDYVMGLIGHNNHGVTIDRINVNGNYEPENLRWATAHIQGANRRISKNNKSGYTGVYRIKKTGMFRSAITVNGRVIGLGDYGTAELSVMARNNYITENGLTEYKIQELKK